MNTVKSLEVPMSRSKRPTYSTSQIGAYFGRINLSPSCFSSPVLTSPELAHTKEHGLPLLAALMRHHLAAIPFENLDLHYSSSRNVTLNMQQVFEKFVEQGSCRGGRCIQINGMFEVVLSSLGFHTTTVAARVNTVCQAVSQKPGYQGPSYNGWDHMAIIVTLSSQNYLVDVGMGGRGPMIPLEMVHGKTVTSVAPRTIRLLHGGIPEHTSSYPLNDLWKLEVCNREGSPWVPAYAFSEIEWLPQDFEVLDWYISTNPRSWFTQKIIVVKMLLDASQKKIVGDLVLFERTFVKRIGGIVELEVQCRSEEERLDLLWKWFGIRLTDHDQKAIRSTISEIP